MKGVPRILGFRHTDHTAEIMMANCGTSVSAFTSSLEFENLHVYHKSCILMDMVRQICKPLAVLHSREYVHGDIKPANICVKKLRPNEPPRYYLPGQPYESEYEFTLIDFGIISRFKVKKATRVNEFVTGNLRYCTLRSLQLIQNRYQDDVEALLFIVSRFTSGNLPWDNDFDIQVRL